MFHFFSNFSPMRHQAAASLGTGITSSLSLTNFRQKLHNGTVRHMVRKGQASEGFASCQISQCDSQLQTWLQCHMHVCVLLGDHRANSLKNMMPHLWCQASEVLEGSFILIFQHRHQGVVLGAQYSLLLSQPCSHPSCSLSCVSSVQGSGILFLFYSVECYSSNSSDNSSELHVGLDDVQVVRMRNKVHDEEQWCVMM